MVPKTDTAIDLQQVSKVYKGRIHALKGISLQVGRGEVFGLLGPNGAGKSTLIKIMMTVVRPTQAQGTILGQPVGHKPTLAQVGYLPENHRFPRYLTGRQTLEFFGALSGMDRANRKRRSTELLGRVGMSQWADKRVGTYSKGMMQRVGLAQALVNDPKLVLLDEPTDGVDPVGRRDIRDVLLEMRDRGTTIFINSHLLGELEMICGRVAILVAGQVAGQGTLDDMAAGGHHYEIDVSPGADALLSGLLVDSAGPGKGKLPSSGISVETRNGTILASTANAADIQELLDALRRGGLTIRRVQAVRPSLEQLFMEAVGQSSSPPPLLVR